ncbi:Predicted ATPase [Cribrihabitans marinus]|uniref:Predicted ATPase n=1 Tax=Cribrihabitans marinus TaxID=1227549 RepID=A0A1H6U027_9RHOB|nr:adenylate/guanylate cyclase domain-containing protein [Cribrihabitans marinus]GGH21088.1 adenylate cyclase [Cribrihabitans marinus]SEI85631.1 Predicted ATPase [Cribrihabitans marinus]
MGGGLDEWLEIHGFVEYRRALEEHDIRFIDLPLLTEEDLKELGLPIGPRRRFLAAIKTMSADLQVAQASRFGGPASKQPEIRHLTLMFVDLVGSTQLSDELDIETYRDLVHEYQTICSNAVRRHHGHLAQFQGDGVIAYFGYPSAEEDDAERAVLTGLEICTVISHLSAPGREPIKVRIGIATGDIVIDLREGHNALALGEAPNLASRIQAVTQPGTVAVSDDTKALLGANFECEMNGDYEFKGFSDPVRIWTVRDASVPELRFESRRRGKTTPIVGREGELLLMESRWHSTLRNSSQFIALCGEAGIGKSRLAEELSARIPREDRLKLSFQCLPNHGGSAFHPVIAAVNHAARITRTDDTDERLRKLRRLLSAWTDKSDTAFPVFARLLSIPLSPEPEHQEVPPEQLKEQFQDVMVGILRELATKKPLLILFEDLHWVDPSTEDLIDLFIEVLRDTPVLIICTFRPSYQPRWQGLARVTSLTISRLEDRHSRQIVHSMNEQQSIPPELEAQIIAKTDGVPLFLEEMTRMIHQRLDAAHTRATFGNALALPETLKDLLRARIDNLATPHDFVSVCAAIGRSIIPAMLPAVTGKSAETIKRLLDHLTEAQILTRRPVGDGTSYHFRHALIQEAAYELMLPSRARKLHQRIAETIVNDFPDLAARMPEQLAHHYSLSNMPENARDAWREAAEHAARQFATEETINHLRAALAENAKVGDVAARDVQELAIRRLLNVALNTHAFGSQEIRENRDRLHQLLDKTSASVQDKFLAKVVQYGTQLMLGEIDNGLKICREMQEIAGLTSDPTMAAISAHSMGMTRFMSASFDDAISCFDEALRLREYIAPDDIFAFYAADIRPVDIAMKAWAVVCRSGEHPELEGLLAAVGEEPHDFSHCYALSILAATHQVAGDVEAVMDLCAKAQEISDKRKFQYWSAWNAILHGWAIARSGDPSAGISELSRGIEDYLATGSTQMTLYARTLLADAWRAAGDFETGLATIEAVREDPLSRSIRYQSVLTESVEAALIAAKSSYK